MTNQQPITEDTITAKMERAKKYHELAFMLQLDMEIVFSSIMVGTQKHIDGHPNFQNELFASRALHLLQGSLITYLFSLWDEHAERTDVEQYFRDAEKLRFYAFKHIRIIAAHNTSGTRLSTEVGREFFHHYKKFNSIMSSKRAINGVKYTHEMIDLSRSNAALDCRQFMQGMAQKLSIRIPAGGPNAKIRGVDGQEHHVF